MKANELKRDLDGLREMGLLRRLRMFDSAPAARSRLDGRRVLHFGSNSYLGLHTHAEVIWAAQRAAAEFGTGSGASLLVSGRTSIHAELESEIADWKGAEDAVLFPSGYQANVGTLSALVGPADLVLSDALNHASIIDGCRLSRAKVFTFEHANTKHLEALLIEHRARHRRCLIITDSIFSMDGDVAPLPEISDLAERFDAFLHVDDAHATGVLGATGGGGAERFDLHGRVDVQMGTLSKALASQGGFVAGSLEMCEYLRNKARAFVFSTSITPPAAAASLAAIRVLRRDPSILTRLRDNATTMREHLSKLGFLVPFGETPIIPVLVGEAQTVLALSDALDDEGVYVPPIRPPSVPFGQSRLRVTVTAGHSSVDIEQALRAFAAAGRRVGAIP